MTEHKSLDCPATKGRGLRCTCGAEPAPPADRPDTPPLEHRINRALVDGYDGAVPVSEVYVALLCQAADALAALRAQVVALTADLKTFTNAARCQAPSDAYDIPCQCCKDAALQAKAALASTRQERT